MEFKVKYSMNPTWDQIDKEIQTKIDEGMKILADKAEAYWRTLIKSELKTSKEIYDKALTVTVSGTNIEFSLKGWLPIGIETKDGRTDHDMKSFPGKNGKNYRIIPVGFNKDLYLTEQPGFRTMSANSPTQSWIHRFKKEPVMFHERVFKEIEDHLIDEVFSDLLTGSRTTI